MSTELEAIYFLQSDSTNLEIKYIMSWHTIIFFYKAHVMDSMLKPASTRFQVDYSFGVKSTARNRCLPQDPAEVHLLLFQQKEENHTAEQSGDQTHPHLCIDFEKIWFRQQRMLASKTQNHSDIWIWLQKPQKLPSPQKTTASLAPRRRILCWKFKWRPFAEALHRVSRSQQVEGNGSKPEVFLGCWSFWWWFWWAISLLF